MNGNDFLVLPVIIAFVGLLLQVGYSFGEKSVRQQAIRLGFAQYDPVTGAWRWKEKGIDNV